MNKSAYTWTFLALSVITMMLTIGFNFYVDPFTYYHQPWRPINISKNHRYSNPGIARQFEYQAVLVGTSLSMELESSRLSELTAMPSINLSITAGLIREQADLIELVLKQAQADTVFWEMHFASFAFGDVIGDGEEEYPQYFYAETIETPLRYLLSFDTLRHSRNALTNPGHVTIDNRNRISPRQYSRQRVLEHWDSQLQIWNGDLRQFWADHRQSMESTVAIIEQRLLPLFRKYPEVRFKLYFPPNSALQFLFDELVAGQSIAQLHEYLVKSLN